MEYDEHNWLVDKIVKKFIIFFFCFLVHVHFVDVVSSYVNKMLNTSIMNWFSQYLTEYR